MGGRRVKENLKYGFGRFAWPGRTRKGMCMCCSTCGLQYQQPGLVALRVRKAHALVGFCRSAFVVANARHVIFS